MTRREWQTVAESWGEFKGSVCGCQSCQHLVEGAFLAGYMASTWNAMAAIGQFVQEGETDGMVVNQYMQDRWQETTGACEKLSKSMGGKPPARH